MTVDIGYSVIRVLRSFYITVSAALLLMGCGDIYDEKITDSGRLTPAEIESIAKALPHSDAALFRLWHERRLRGERFGGEPTVFNVRDAIMVQNEYEAKQAELNRQVAAIENEKKQKFEAEQAELRKNVAEAQLQMNRSKRADQEIKKLLLVEAKNFQLAPKFDKYGNNIGQEWVFNLAMHNLSDAREVIGISGKIVINDAFGKPIGTYPARIEPVIPPKKRINYSVAMTHDWRDPGMALMEGSKTLFYTWQMESLVYRDGTRVDASTFAQK